MTLKVCDQRYIRYLKKGCRAMIKAKKNLLIIILIIVLATILGFLWFARSTVTFPIIRTEDQAERNIKTLYFYDEEEYKNSELEVIDSCENDEFVLYAYTIDGKLGYAMYEFVSLGRVSDNGCVQTTDDYLFDIIKYNGTFYLVMVREENIGAMIASEKNRDAQIVFEPNGEAGIYMWKLDNEVEFSYDVYDQQGNAIAENEIW